MALTGDIPKLFVIASMDKLLSALKPVLTNVSAGAQA